MNGNRRELEHSLILDNRGFVYSMANRYASSGVPFCDLVSAGILGLLKAAKKYEVGRESKFISFATSWVQHEMIKVIRETRFPCRIPLNLNSTVNRIRRGEEDESTPEFAALLPLLKPPSEETAITSYETHEETVVDKISIQQALHFLDDRSRQMIKMHVGLIGEARGISEIAKEFNLSKQRVRSLIASGLVQLKRYLE